MEYRVPRSSTPSNPIRLFVMNPFVQVNLTIPAETLKTSISMTLLDKLNSRHTHFHKSIEETLYNLSMRTKVTFVLFMIGERIEWFKNEMFLGRFIELDGLPMLRDLILYCHLNTCFTEEASVKLSEVLANISQKTESLELIQHKCRDLHFLGFSLDGLL